MGERGSISLEPIMPTLLVCSRYTAFSRQSGRCLYCDFPMWLDDPDGFRSRYSLTLAQARLLRCTAEHLRARQNGCGLGRVARNVHQREG